MSITPIRNWTEIEPRDAVDIVLPRGDITGPFNEAGEPCPWPWDPQQLVGQPLGQYHCPLLRGERHRRHRPSGLSR
jgi:hypothetical protein